MRRSSDRAEDARQVMRMIETAVANGKPCPSNIDISHKLGMQSPSGAVKVLASLEKRGLIEIERFGASRRVTIAATGRSTAVIGSQRPHFRAGKKGALQLRSVPRVEATLEEKQLIRVDRDPCFYCNTRKDLGCKHHPLEVVA